MWRRLFHRWSDSVAPTSTVLYRYVPADRCHYWLRDETIAFAALEKLNDPYEGLILNESFSGAGATLIREDVPVRMIRVGNMSIDAINPEYDPDAKSRRVREQDSKNRELAARYAEQLAFVRNMGILSLTPCPDNMVMWAHYASKSAGLCIGINLQNAGLIGNDNENHLPLSPGVVLPVEYGKAPSMLRGATNDEFIARALGRKHADWAYERETRILRRLNTFERFADVANRIGLIALRPDCVAEIIFGVSPAPSTIALVRETLPKYSSALLRQLRVSSDSYRPRVQDLKGTAELC